MTDYIYDIESYPDVFTLTAKNVATGCYLVFECSARRNDKTHLMAWLVSLRARGDRMVGFNNNFYDYPVIHAMWLDNSSSPAHIAYNATTRIINTPFESRWSNTIRAGEQLATQVDLYMIHHFDNPSKRTSLKALEFAMHAESIQDLPFPPGTHLTDTEIDTLIAYNRHDVENTYHFYLHTLPAIKLREELTVMYGIDCINYNDTKIGKEYFLKRLRDEIGPQITHTVVGTKRVLRQSPRKQIDLDSIILPYIQFSRPEFCSLLNWYKSQIITGTKGVFTELPIERMGSLLPYMNTKQKNGKIKNLNVILDKLFQLDYGTGGIHGSVQNTVVKSTDDKSIIDFDVSSFYPNLAIRNRFYPEHLGESFCHIYEDIYDQRSRTKKGTPENATLKLALNGVYGDSNNKFSAFYDPRYTMAITINGQLLITLLIEWLLEIGDLELIQANTDGVTMRVKNSLINAVINVISRFEKLTGLKMERTDYNRMFLMNVNNYLAETIYGDIKRKGCYEYRQAWHKDWSTLVIPRAAEAHMIHGIPIRDFIVNHQDDYDFFALVKVNRDCRLLLDGEPIQRISRCYISKTGGELTKVMPPLPKNPNQERRSAVMKGSKVTICNDTVQIDRRNIDYEWYLNEANKLLVGY